LKYEQEDGSFKEMPIYGLFGILAAQTAARGFTPLVLFTPELAGYTLTATDKIYKRNCQTLKDEILRVIAERQQKR